MTIAKDIITEINYMDEEYNEEYVYVSDNFTINDFNDVVNELYLMHNISLKYIEMFHFIITMNNENNFQYDVELIKGLDDEIFFKINRTPIFLIFCFRKYLIT